MRTWWTSFGCTLGANTGHTEVFSCLGVYTGSGNLIHSWVSLFFLSAVCTQTSDIPSLEAPWGVRDYHRGRMWAALCCFGVWFPEDRRSDEGAWIEGRGSKQSLFHPHFLLDFLCLLTTYGCAACSLSWAVTTPSLFYAHPPTQSHKSCSGTEASLEEMPTSPHVSTCLLCDPEWYFLAGPLTGAPVPQKYFISIISISNLTTYRFLCSHTATPSSL